jgi:hypothetical protein
VSEDGYWVSGAMYSPMTGLWYAWVRHGKTQVYESKSRTAAGAIAGARAELARLEWTAKAGGRGGR